ncbi:PIN domain-containing protein [soil metagenome]
MRVILDTGPLVALVNRREARHGWAREKVAALRAPFLTCEAVVSEACFLLRNVVGGPATVMSLLVSGSVKASFDLDEQAESVTALMRRYQSVPMSLADACLVRMAELYEESSLLTFDSDFTVYRKHLNQIIPLIAPENLG